MSASIKTNNLDKMKKANLLLLGKQKGLKIKQSVKKANLIQLLKNGKTIVKTSPALENMKKPNLLLFGKKKGIDVKQSMTKGTIIKLIRNGPKEKNIENMTKEELYKFGMSKKINLPRLSARYEILRIIRNHVRINASPAQSAKTNFRNLPVDELYKFAKNRLIPVTPLMTKKQMIAEISKSPKLAKKATPALHVPTRYDGWQITNYMAFMYLALKRRSLYHFLLDKDIHTNFTIDPTIIENFGISIDEDRIIVRTNIYRLHLRKFMTLRKNWLIIPVMLRNPTSAHANIILYNKSKQHLEYFEPHGFRSMYYIQRTTKYAETCKKKLENMGLPIKSLEIIGGTSCQKGPQHYNSREIFKKKTGDPGGFCQAWVSWFVDYRLKYPNENASVLITNAIISLMNEPKGFKNFIRSYAEFVVDFMNVHAPNCKVSPWQSYACRQDLHLLYDKVIRYLATKTGKIK